MSVALTLDRAWLESQDYRPLHAGDTYPIAVTATEVGVAIPLSKVWLTVKRSAGDSDSSALLSLSSDDVSQIEITSSVNGQFIIKFNPAETAGIAGRWPFDIQVKDTSDNVVTLAYGTIEFLPNITRDID